ncbi:hypothetical protein F8M41_017608 [Gigaspora margarita]|uniref:Uncharacterized protein n=1 Tax=Gigaspora margarita TaxID=4874 RepID=A0A8H4AMX7_GIGMA|nr:hypothetical protein F8M41_017608 [Gigaspora margarita]
MISQKRYKPKITNDNAEMTNPKISTNDSSEIMKAPISPTTMAPYPVFQQNKPKIERKSYSKKKKSNEKKTTYLRISGIT